MNDYAKTREKIDGLPEEQQEIAKSLLESIEYWERKVQALRKCETYQVDPKNPLRQRELPAHKMIKDAEQQLRESLWRLTQMFNKDRIISDADPFDLAMSEYDE